MYKRLLVITLLSQLFSISATGQDTGLVREGARQTTGGIAAINADRGTGFHLRGVLISKSGRSALVNDRLTREGDTVAGAEILAISEGSVRILVGSEELNVPVGARAFSGRVSRPNIQITRNRGRSEPPLPTLPSPRTDDTKAKKPVAVAKSEPTLPEHRVQRGETLASIAKLYLRQDLALEQAMMAIFEANPQAFSNNINVLFEGAVLQIPGAGSGNTLAGARKEVQRHMAAWRDEASQKIQMAVEAAPEIYGPIRSGETLSAVAIGLSPTGITTNQMMMALYAANPQAFSGNINFLKKDASLRVPPAEEVLLMQPDAATAEVQRHAEAWRGGHSLQARLAPFDIPATAEIRESAFPAGALALH